MPYSVIGGIGTVELIGDTAMQNPGNVLTLNNCVMLCGDATLTNYTANTPFLQFSESNFDPATELKVPVCVTTDNRTNIIPLTVSPSGELSLPFDYSSAIVHLTGIVINVNSKYYTPEIGNIYNNGTSPLTDSLD